MNSTGKLQTVASVANSAHQALNFGVKIFSNKLDDLIVLLSSRFSSTASR